MGRVFVLGPLVSRGYLVTGLQVRELSGTVNCARTRPPAPGLTQYRPSGPWAVWGKEVESRRTPSQGEPDTAFGFGLADPRGLSTRRRCLDGGRRPGREAVAGDRRKGPQRSDWQQAAETISGRRLTSVTPSLGLPWNSSCALLLGVDRHLLCSEAAAVPGALRPHEGPFCPPASQAPLPSLRIHLRPSGNPSVRRRPGLHPPGSSRERCLPPGLREGPLERPPGLSAVHAHAGGCQLLGTLLESQDRTLLLKSLCPGALRVRAEGLQSPARSPPSCDSAPGPFLGLLCSSCGRCPGIAHTGAHDPAQGLWVCCSLSWGSCSPEGPTAPFPAGRYLLSVKTLWPHFSPSLSSYLTWLLICVSGLPVSIRGCKDLHRTPSGCASCAQPVLLCLLAN